MKPDRVANHIYEVANRLQPFHGDDERLGLLLSLCVGRVMLNAARRSEDWRAVATDSQIRHVSDWLSASIINDSVWLQNVDDRQRPKKLMKFATMAAIVAEADKAMRKAAQTISNISLIEGDEILHQELGDGHYIVRLLTSAALDRESAMMQHCIGNGAYDERVNHPNYVYLSLRSPSGKAHATLEIQEGEITQLSGKQNKTLIKAHMDRLIPFLRRSKYRAGVPATELGYVVDEDGVWHALDALPEGLRVAGNLELEDCPINALPVGLKVSGSLYLQRSRVTTLPEGLEVGGDLNLYCTSVAVFPETFKVRGSLYLSQTLIDRLPEGLNVGGDLHLSRSPISALPKGLIVGGTLTLDFSKIRFLPDGLSVGGNLDLSDSAILALPDGLIVGGNLYASETFILSLPKRLSVGKDLDLRYTYISVLPDDMSVAGTLELSGTKLTSLPKGLMVAGDLGLEELAISALPDDLKVGGSIYLRGSPITTLPESISDETIIFDDDGKTTAKRFRKRHAAGNISPSFSAY